MLLLALAVFLFAPPIPDELTLPRADLMIGASVSEEWTISHQTQAETLAHFLAELKAGMAERLDGISLYPSWELNQQNIMLIIRSLNR